MEPSITSKLIQPSCSTLPETRLKQIVTNAEVEINTDTPASCYVRSGKEMIRSANNYNEDGSLENAYLLYMRFLIIFVEKIHSHPGYKSLPALDKKSIKSYCEEIFPKTEILKKQLLSQFELEYENYKKNMEIIKKHQQDEEKKQKEEKEKEERFQTNLARLNQSIMTSNHISSSIKAGSGGGSIGIGVGVGSGGFSHTSNINADYPTVISPTSNSSIIRNDMKYPKTQENGVSSVSSSAVVPLPHVDRTVKPSRILSPISAGLRNVSIPGNLVPEFLKIAKGNTSRNIETCGILAGKIIREVLVITHLIIPKQRGTADSCTTENEEQIFSYQDKFNLITLGWVHTHPTQTAFLSSVDLHTHHSYQLMMPEAIAIVCAPAKNDTGIFMLNPTYGMDTIGSCQASGFHPHNQSSTPIFQDASHAEYDQTRYVTIFDLRYQS